ncbi:cytochrome P450 [Amylostereum chailletii]|nr:cytochrome P450 [Amylostereum chailletii]
MAIMEKEGAATADRPRSEAGEMITRGMRLLLTGVGKRFRLLRRAVHSHLQSNAILEYQHIQIFNAKQVIYDILDDPENHVEHPKRYAASLILSITYGKPSPSNKSDLDVMLVEESTRRLGKSLRPGAFLVDDYPWLKYVPFYGRTLRQYHRDELSLFRRQLQAVRDDMAKGPAKASFGKHLIENRESLGLSDDEIAYLAGAMFSAGSETTAAALSYVIMAAACHPEAQVRVQEELDSTVAFGRLPAFSDAKDLPHVEAFVREALRWRPITAGGIPHATTKDIAYRNYVIPSGTVLLANHWAISRDPHVFPDGDRFTPQRWFNDEGILRQDLNFPGFGFGRRICPGQALAQKSLFLNTAMLLQAFEITPKPGCKIDTLDVREGINILPQPFPVHFRVRHPGGALALRALLALE